MLTRLFARFLRLWPRSAVVPPALVIVGVTALGLTSACDKVPLLAPTGSTIALSAPVSILPVNGKTQITANVISSGGQAVHNGTTITFTSNLGTFEPSSDVQTLNGRATVTFVAGTESGVASITASSGGANVSLPPSSGAANGSTGGTTTPSSLTIKIGGAAVSTIALNASPATIASKGGKSTISATVLDGNGNALAGVPVTFTTDHGTLSSATDVSDASGEAWTTLTTSITAKVTATAGSVATGTTTTSPTSGAITVNVSAAPVLLITPPSSAPSAGLPASFTFQVTVPTENGGSVRDVTVDWGDGSSEQDLGVIDGSQTASHVFPKADDSKTYTVTGTVTDSLGNVNEVSTAVSVVPVAPPTVIITVQSTGTGIHPATVTFELQVTTPSGVTAQSVTVDWGDGQTQDLGGLSGNVTLTHLYGTSGAKTVKVTAKDSLGRSTTGNTTLTLS